MRFFKVFLMVLVAAMLAACGGRDAKDVALDFENAVIKGDVDKIFSMLDMSDEDKKHEQEIKGKLAYMIGGIPAEVKKKDGLDKIEVENENCNDTYCSVNLKIYFNDGSSKDDRVKLKKVDGTWKINPK